MTIALVESFDGPVFGQKWSGFHGNRSSSGGVPNQGLYASFDWNGHNMHAQLPAAAEHAVIGCAKYVYMNGFTLQGSFRSDGGATTHVTWHFNGATGDITVYRGTSGGGTLLGTAAAALPLSVFAHVEVIATLGDAPDGAVEVWINDAQVLNLTGIDTKNGGTKTVFDHAWPVVASSDSSGNQVRVDSVVVWTGADLGDGNTSRIGPHAVYRQVLEADSTPLDWTPSSGSDHYALVEDGTTANDADYLFSSTPGNIDTFDFDDLATNLDVRAVAITIRGLLSEAGPRSVRSRIKSGTSTTNGVTHALGVGVTGRHDIYEADPDTGIKWTATGVNNAKAQLELVS